MRSLVDETDGVDVVIMSHDPTGLSVELSIVEVQTAVVGTAQQLPTVVAERHAEDAELRIVWTEGQGFVLVLLATVFQGNLVETVGPRGVDQVLAVWTDSYV